MNQNLKINTSLIFPGLPFSAHLHMRHPPATRNPLKLPEHLLEDDEQGGDHREDQDYKQGENQNKKRLGPKEIFDPKKFGTKKSGVKKNLCPKKMWG